jgi:hypothetical protein
VFGPPELKESSVVSSLQVVDFAPQHKHDQIASTRVRPAKSSKVPSTPKAAAIFARTMTCEMSLRVLNIPKAMHTCLGLGKAFPVV